MVIAISNLDRTPVPRVPHLGIFLPQAFQFLLQFLLRAANLAALLVVDRICTILRPWSKRAMEHGLVL